MRLKGPHTEGTPRGLVTGAMLGEPPATTLNMWVQQYDPPVWWVGTNKSPWYPLSTCLPAWLLKTDHLAHMSQVEIPNAFA